MLLAAFEEGQEKKCRSAVHLTVSKSLQVTLFQLHRALSFRKKKYRQEMLRRFPLHQLKLDLSLKNSVEFLTALQQLGPVLRALWHTGGELGADGRGKA